VKVVNVHYRDLRATAEAAGALIDSLASKNDRLWPRELWPAMKFDAPLSVGAKGGHGPIRYFIKAYDPGHSIVFQFTAPSGFDGNHMFEVETNKDGHVRLVHSLKMTASGWGCLSWSFVFRPLHDALIEDSLYKAEQSLGCESNRPVWSPYVRLLRWAVRK
jgi:hypothetical protein